MPAAQGYLRELLANLGRLRQQVGLTPAQLEERLILGPGWVKRFESGKSVPSIDMLLAILHQLSARIQDLLDDLPLPNEADVQRPIFAVQNGANLTVHFNYAKYDARYTLPNGQLADFEAVIKMLRDGLAKNDGQNQTLKAEAVAKAFLYAVQVWPHVNPSDVWWFVIYRAYCDPYNHPAQDARLSFEQSWKRTGGWALEKILVRHYGRFLKDHGVNILIEDDAAKEGWVRGLYLEGRVEADKIDVVLTGDTPRGPIFFGIVNVKASFAERRTDDVPLSEVMIRNGYASPLWTMDCKSMPGTAPRNRGELGPVRGQRSAKREDIESSGSFTGCFSYNRNTEPSPEQLPPERRVYICDFRNPDDTFSRFILEQWKKFQRRSKVIRAPVK